MKKLLIAVLTASTIFTMGCGKTEVKEEVKTTKGTPVVEDKIEEAVEEQEVEEVEQPSMEQYLDTLEGKYIYEDRAMSGEDLTQNTKVTYSEENRAIEIDINLTMLDPNADAYGYIKALIDGQYSDTMEDMCDISIKEVNEASAMAYELGFEEIPAHISCTIFIKDAPIAGAFQGRADDEPKVYYRIDQDK